MKNFDYKTADAGTINKAIQSIKLRAASITQDVQDVALATIIQVRDHGNVTPMNNLYNSMGEGMRKQALLIFLTRFGGVVINSKPKERKAGLVLIKGDKPVNLDGAIAQPWYTIKTEPKTEDIFDINKAVAALVKRASKDGVKTNNPALVQALMALDNQNATVQ